MSCSVYDPSHQWGKAADKKVNEIPDRRVSSISCDSCVIRTIRDISRSSFLWPWSWMGRSDVFDPPSVRYCSYRKCTMHPKSDSLPYFSTRRFWGIYISYAKGDSLIHKDSLIAPIFGLLEFDALECDSDWVSYGVVYSSKRELQFFSLSFLGADYTSCHILLPHHGSSCRDTRVTTPQWRGRDLVLKSHLFN